MDILLVVGGVLVGVTMRPIYEALRNWRASRQPLQNSFTVSPASPYDTAIDTITENGLERLQLHRASTSLGVRKRLRGTELYKRAAPVLGWED